MNWTSPEDETTFPSNGSVLFDASTSWDMDNDPLTFAWTTLLMATCLRAAPVPTSGEPPLRRGSFTVNSENDPYGCTSDGVTDRVQVCGPRIASSGQDVELVNGSVLPWSSNQASTFGANS